MHTPPKLGIFDWTIPYTSLNRKFQFVAETGLAGIEIDLGRYDDGLPVSKPEQQHELLALATQWKIEIPTLGLNAFCSHSMNKPAHRNVMEEIFTKGIEAAVAMNIPTLQVPSFFASAIESPDDFSNTVAAFRFACREARGTGLTIGTENALTADQQLQLLEEVDDPNFKIYFDTLNATSMSGLNSPAILKQLLPHLCEVHIKDGTNDQPSVLLGAGDCGFFESMELLKSAAYTGWFQLENQYGAMAEAAGEDPELLCRKDIETAQRVLQP